MPPTGLICIACPRVGSKGNYYQQDIRATIEQTSMHALALATSNDVFFNVHTLKKERVWVPSKDGGDGKWQVRVHSNMAEAKCLFCDVDVGPGKDYATRTEARAAMLAFIQATGLPLPTIVSSGNGLHLYWTFDRPLPSTSWLEMAETFKRLVNAAAFHVDPSRLTDRASVLRVPGTFHRKDPANPKLVTVLHVGQHTTVEELQHTIETALARITANRAAGRDVFDFTGAETVQGQRPESYAQPATLTDQVRACELFRNSIGTVTSEPQWYFGQLNIARHLKNGEAAAHFVSSKHPDYAKDETAAKLAQLARTNGGKVGPTTCRKMGDLFGTEPCTRCHWRDKPDSSPVVAARNLPKVQTVAEVEAGICPPPFPYTRLAAGGIRYAPIEGAPLVICSYDLYPRAIIVHEDGDQRRTEILWACEMPGSRGTITFTVPGPALYDARLLQQHLANNGVFEQYDNVKFIREYMSAYVKSLQKHAADSRQHRQLGWTEDYKSFVMPYGLVTKGGRSEAILSPNVIVTGAGVTQAGTLKRQVELLRFYDHTAFVRHQFYIIASAASILLHATKLHGVVVNLSGSSGASKSTALMTATAFWGDPSKLMLNGTHGGMTENARNQRIGTMKNLPTCIDEITHIEADNLKNLVMMISQADPTKITLNVNRSEQRVPLANKSALMLSTSNGSLHDRLSQANIAGVAGSMRAFEINVDRVMIHDKRSADGFIRESAENFGHIGPAFVDHVTRHHQELIAAVIQRQVEIDRMGAAEQHERYWSAVIAVVLVAGETLFKMGLVPYPMRAVEAWAIAEQLREMRGVLRASYSTPVEVLLAYISTISNDTLVMVGSDAKKDWVVRKGPNRELLARYEVNGGLLFVNIQHLRRYCIKVGTPFMPLSSELEKAGIVETMRYTLSKGSPDYNTGQSNVLKIMMRHPAISGKSELETAEASNVVSIETARVA